MLYKERAKRLWQIIGQLKSDDCYLMTNVYKIFRMIES